MRSACIALASGPLERMFETRIHLSPKEWHDYLIEFFFVLCRPFIIGEKVRSLAEARQQLGRQRDRDREFIHLADEALPRTVVAERELDFEILIRGAANSMPHLVVVPIDHPVVRHLNEELPVFDLQTIAEERFTHSQQRRSRPTYVQVGNAMHNQSLQRTGDKPDPLQAEAQRQ